MKTTFTLLIMLSFLVTAQTKTEKKPYGVIAKIKEDGKPVILSISQGAIAKKEQFGMLIIFAWKYKGNKSSMPTDIESTKMKQLEDELVKIAQKGLAVHAVTRTGNNLKEWEYYIKDSESYMKAFNDHLKEHERYPIKINFYKDPKWKELKRFTDMIKK